jgi:hypothetical protein
VETGDVWSSIADHQIAKLASESLEDLGQSLPFRNVSHDVMDVVNWSNFLQIDRNNPFPLCLVSLGAIGKQPHLAQLLPADLTPAAGRSTEIDDPLDILKDVEDVIDL